MPEAKATEDGVTFEVHVTPCARCESVTYVDGILRVKTTAEAEKGKANRAVVAALEPFFGACEIVRGFRSRRKTVHALNTDYSAYMACLDALASGKTM